jgi:hypothetical protein
MRGEPTGDTPASPSSLLPFYHECSYKNATEDKYSFTTDRLKWLGVLYSSIDAGHKIAVPMSSKMEADTLYNNLLKRYPQMKEENSV